MSMYWTCPYCHSNLDHGEHCDCHKKQVANNQKGAVFTMLPSKKHTKTLKLRTGGA